jgi:chemotaxis protein MotB
MNLKRREDGRPVIELDANLLFGPMRHRVSPDHFASLDRIAETIASTRYPVMIEGHTDAIPARGKHSNFYLSAARAASVQEYLEHAAGLQPGLITAVGMGSSSPHPEAKSPRDARHRRVEIVFEIQDRAKKPYVLPESQP